MDAAFAANGMDRHDMGVVKMGRRLRLVLEAAQVARVQGSGEREHLQCYASFQRALLRLVNDAHAAAPHFADQAEIAQLTQLPGRLGQSRQSRGAMQAQRGMVQELQAGQVRSQWLSEVGMACQQDIRVRRGAVLQLGQVSLQYVHDLVGARTD